MEINLLKEIKYRAAQAKGILYWPNRLHASLEFFRTFCATWWKTGTHCYLSFRRDTYTNWVSLLNSTATLTIQHAASLNTGTHTHLNDTRIHQQHLFNQCACTHTHTQHISHFFLPESHYYPPRPLQGAQSHFYSQSQCLY